MISRNQSFTKKMLASILLFTPSLSFSNLSEDAISACYEHKVNGAWQYLEYNFVVKPNNELQARAKIVQSVIFSTAALGLLATSLYNFDKFNQPEKGGSLLAGQLPKLTIENSTYLGCGILGFVTYVACYSKFESSIKKNTLIKFLQNWSHHKDFIPAELVSAFDELATSFQASTTKDLTDGQVAEIFEIVQHLIEHSFEKRYPKDKSKDVDVLNTLKTMSDIGKNLK